MATHILWFFDNSTSTPGTQLNVGPFNPGTVDRIFKAYVHANMSFQSFNSANPWQESQDVLWGFQWVAHGAAPNAILTSASDDRWLWRHASAANNDISRAYAPGSSTGVVQSTFSLVETYRGQGIRPGGNTDVYLSFQDMFGLVSVPMSVIGSIDFYFD